MAAADQQPQRLIHMLLAPGVLAGCTHPVTGSRSSQAQKIPVLAGHQVVASRSGGPVTDDLRASTCIELPWSPDERFSLLLGHAIWKTAGPVIPVGLVENGNGYVIDRFQPTGFKGYSQVRRVWSCGSLHARDVKIWSQLVAAPASFDSGHGRSRPVRHLGGGPGAKSSYRGANRCERANYGDGQVHVRTVLDMNRRGIRLASIHAGASGCKLPARPCSGVQQCSLAWLRSTAQDCQTVCGLLYLTAVPTYWPS